MTYWKKKSKILNLLLQSEWNAIDALLTIPFLLCTTTTHTYITTNYFRPIRRHTHSFRFSSLPNPPPPPIISTWTIHNFYFLSPILGWNQLHRLYWGRDNTNTHPTLLFLILSTLYIYPSFSLPNDLFPENK